MLILKINKKIYAYNKNRYSTIVGVLCKVNSPKLNIYVMRILSVFLTPKKSVFLVSGPGSWAGCNKK